jgi:hypothetical protein
MDFSNEHVLEPTIERFCMSYVVPIISDKAQFKELPATAKLAIVVPTARWNPMVQSIIGAMLGIANEEIVVLIADNSENPEKREFLTKIGNINPNIISIAHKENIGSAENFYYLYEWSRHVEYIAHMADDDWVSPAYYADSYKSLLAHPDASGAEVGTTLVDIGDGKLVDVSQPSMCGDSPEERIAKWNGIAARVTMYCASRRVAVNAAIQYIRTTPLSGTTLAEDLWELSRLSDGNFLHESGHGCLVHYPARGRAENNQQLVYESLYKGAGLQYPFVFFGGLSTAIQCAMFLIGKYSPISDAKQRIQCGQMVFSHIFSNSFLPVLATQASQEVAAQLFANHPAILSGLAHYCNPPFSQNPVFDQELVNWFIRITRALDLNPGPEGNSSSSRFEEFANFILG